MHRVKDDKTAPSGHYQLVHGILLVTDHEDSAEMCEPSQNVCHANIKIYVFLHEDMWSFLPPTFQGTMLILFHSSTFPQFFKHI